MKLYYNNDLASRHQAMMSLRNCFIIINVSILGLIVTSYKTINKKIKENTNDI